MIDDSSPYSLKQEFYCFPIGSVKGEGKIQRRSFDILHNLRVQRVLLRFRILHNKVINLHGKAFHAIGTDSLQSARFCVELTHLWIRLIRDLVFTRQQHYCKRNNSNFFHIFIVLVWNRNLSLVSYGANLRKNNKIPDKAKKIKSNDNFFIPHFLLFHFIFINLHGKL